MLVLKLAMAYSTRPELLPIDGVTLPGSEARVGLRVVDQSRQGLRSGISGVKIRFEEELSEGGEAPSEPIEVVLGVDGLALMTLKAPEKPGLRRFRAQVDPSGNTLFASREASLLLLSVPTNAPMIFVAIPQTIESPSDEESLRALGNSGAIVYLALRGLDNPERLRDWLKTSKLPSGPILTPQSGLAGRSLEVLLASLQLSRWRRKPWAIIPLEFDSTPFVSNGVRTIRLGAALTARAGEVMLSGAPDWKEARKIVEASR